MDVHAQKKIILTISFTKHQKAVDLIKGMVCSNKKMRYSKEMVVNLFCGSWCWILLFFLMIALSKRPDGTRTVVESEEEDTPGNLPGGIPGMEMLALTLTMILMIGNPRKPLWR